MALKKIFCIIIVILLAAGYVYPQQQKKMKIKTVHFEGNGAFKEKRLLRVMVSRPTGFLSKSYYYPEVFKDDLRALELFYRQNGYLEFMINSYNVRTDTSANEVHIGISVEEGELTRIEGVSVLGNIVFNDEL